MKYLSSVLLISIFLMSSLFAAQNRATTSGSRVPVAKDKIKATKVTYISVAKDLVKKNMKGKLSPAELDVIQKFIKGERQNAAQVVHFESAIKKHSCFVPQNRKSKNLTMFPGSKVSPNWFSIDCTKPLKSKKGSEKSAASKSSGKKGSSRGGSAK